jgi:tetratricopeptide (TPR) repeat protein
MLPHFNTNPPPILRILGAASWGRADALGNTMRDFPADLATDLWWRVERRLRHPSDLRPDECRHASDLMLRLGHLREAAEVLGMRDADPETHVFGAESAVEELAVLGRRPHDRSVLEERALRLARDPAFPARVRLIMANFVVVRNGRRGSDTPAMHEAADLALKAMGELESGGFAWHLASQKVYRAVAYVPFLRGDADGTFKLLDQALAHQMSAKAEAAGELERLAWIDHAFPLYETIARAHLRLGNVDDAVAATDQLTVLSPNDQRAWDARGQALVKAGRLDEALVAYGRAIPLGGLPVARAAYHLGWIHARLGNRDEARSYYRLSWKVDPTVPALAQLIENAAG